MRKRNLMPALAASAMALGACSLPTHPSEASPPNFYIEAVQSASFNWINDTLPAGDTIQFYAFSWDSPYVPPGCIDWCPTPNKIPIASGLVTWETTDPRVVTVDATGLVHATGVGSARIRGTLRANPADTGSHPVVVVNALR